MRRKQKKNKRERQRNRQGTTTTEKKEENWKESCHDLLGWHTKYTHQIMIYFL
jgi:hypothetical protein